MPHVYRIECVTACVFVFGLGYPSVKRKLHLQILQPNTPLMREFKQILRVLSASVAYCEELILDC